ncbi:MAG: glycosyltransferase family 4 protein [Proteobacteria bacterium]|nr:glycosyltransferase family 4 protein [Pseudomonadota bacterium]
MARVVFFLQGHKVPAARARGFLVADALGQAGVTCELRVPYPSVYGDTTLPYPWSQVRTLLRPVAAAVQLAHLRDLRADDVIYFQRPMVEFPITAIERLAARGRKSVFDFDDAIFLGFGNRRKVARLIELADHVVTGNRYLAEEMGALAKTTVIPTVVDAEKFAMQPTRDRRGKDVVIGWTGLRGNYPQLLTALPGLKRALYATGAKLLLISNGPPPDELAALGATYVPWSAATEVADLAAIDIGLMPLPDTPFTRGKCAFKQIQYMALGRPGLASPVGANKEVVTDGVDGYLPTSADAWAEHLIALVGDPDLRATIGRAARARVESAYSMAAVLPRYLSVLDRLGARR